VLSIIIGIMFSIGFLFACFIFKKQKNGTNKHSDSILKFAYSLHLEKYQVNAESIGWNFSKGELLILICISIIIAMLLSIAISNPFILIAGIVLGIYLPAFIIEKKRNSNRMFLISKLTNPLRILISRIPDQQNITRAIEVTRDETTNERIKQLFSNYILNIAVGESVRDALLEMRNKVKLRKFDIFIEYLIQAHYEGFTPDAMKALDKAVEAIEFDLRAIEKVKEQSKIKKKKLYTSLGTAWLFPLILSFVNTGHTNVYLHSIAGKILIMMYCLGSLYVFRKGEEYLSLNLDEI